jgi:hypothetical protein
MPPETPQKSRSEQARINGAKSRGPITAEGKAKSSRNALKHGYAAKTNTLIGPDDSEAWHAHLAGYWESYAPADYQETDFVEQLASLSWRQARLVGMETALLDFQLCIQEEKVDECFPDEKGNPYLQLALAWQSLARKAFGGSPAAVQNEANEPAPMDIDMESLELVRRYQVSLDRQFRNTLLNFRQYREGFGQTSAEQNEPEEAAL